MKSITTKKQTNEIERLTEVIESPVVAANPTQLQPKADRL